MKSVSKSAMSTMAYISQVYRDAPNISYPQRVFTDSELDDILKCGYVNGPVKMLVMLYTENVDPQNRVAW